MNFESKVVNYVNETSLGKDLSEKIDWKDFYDKAKDTSGKTLKDFEKKYSGVVDRPHIADAFNKTKDFKSFMKFIGKFEK